MLTNLFALVPLITSDSPLLSSHSSLSALTGCMTSCRLQEFIARNVRNKDERIHSLVLLVSFANRSQFGYTPSCRLQVIAQILGDNDAGFGYTPSCRLQALFSLNTSKKVLFGYTPSCRLQVRFRRNLLNRLYSDTLPRAGCKGACLEPDKIRRQRT